MTKLNWAKAKTWKEPEYNHLPLKEYLEAWDESTPPIPSNLQHLYDWDIEQYNETKRKERELADHKERSFRGRQKAKAYYEWLHTPVQCQGCGKKRKPKDNHTIKCDTKKLQTYGWHYGEPYPIHSEETLAKQAAQKAYRQTSEYKEELKRRRKARKTQKHIIERNAKLKKRVKEGKQNG